MNCRQQMNLLAALVAILAFFGSRAIQSDDTNTPPPCSVATLGPAQDIVNPATVYAARRVIPGVVHEDPARLPCCELH
jgi:hypothetical protein